MGIGALWEDDPGVEVVDVAVEVDAPELLPTYSYRVPGTIREAVRVGCCVHVPFGGREVLGYVMALRSVALADPLCSRLKDVIAPVAGAVTFGEEQAATAQWMAGRYLCQLTDAVRCIAPAAMGARVVTTVRLADARISARDAGASLLQAHIVETLRTLGGQAELEQLRDASRVSGFTGSYAALQRKGLVVESREVSRPRVVTRKVRAYEPGPGTGDGRVSEPGRRILEVLADLARSGRVPAQAIEILGAARASASSLKTLVARGMVTAREVEVRRAPLQMPAERTVPPRLTPAQSAASRYLASLVGGAGGRPLGEGSRAEAPTALLFGVTASGKTEVYLNAIARTLDAGRSAIVLVPEIALTTQVVEVFTGRFGDQVAVLHSRLSEGERHDEWRRLQDSKARIAVGARSAVFAPVEDVGLIVVDEEHEASYKQESTPRYHARDVAGERARLSGAVLLLGSATPALETFHAAQRGQIALLRMGERIDDRPLPNVSVVDLREEWKENRALFSRQLVEEMGARLARGQQTILFLNRRGYAQFVLCRDCGYVARCPNCAVSLAFHAAWSSLKCHHCDYSRRAPTVCPTCGGERIKGFGIGTERVEEEVARHFPSARVARLDRDTTARKGAHAGILRRFREGQADILIGTQMVAKGLDFPNVTLVGVISADTSINMPDFRAAERTFQLLTQVAGRAGRGEHPGAVVVQTFSPDHYSVQRATHQDYPGFYEKEIAFRQELRYPPFSRFANLVCAAEEIGTARGRAETVAEACRAVVAREVEVIGPAPAPLSRLKGLYRWHVVVRAPLEAPLSEQLRSALARLPAAERRAVTVDVDPASMA